MILNTLNIRKHIIDYNTKDKLKFFYFNKLGNITALTISTKEIT
jgi:hypothetical protein